MSATKTAKEVLHVAASALDALQVIQTLTRTGGDKAASALATIGVIVSAVFDGLEGTIDPKEVDAAIEKLRTSLAGNDAVAFAALAAKFPRKD